MNERAGSVASTRERILAAARGLFLEKPFEDVTLASIATAAEVSHQTVLNHFESKEGVVLAVADMLREETVRTRGAATPGTISSVLRVLIDDYEHMGDANVRWITTAERVTTLAALLDDARRTHQEWIVTMFGASLPSTPAARRRAIHALHAATDVYTWKLLRRDLHLSRTDTERIMADLVAGVLKGTAP
jgi:AcrR family transcriptional regulator